MEVKTEVSYKGVMRLFQKMRQRLPDSGKIIVTVGYTAAYALYLHEKKEMKWKGLPRGSRLGGQGGYARQDQETVNRIRVLKGAVRFAKRQAWKRSSAQRETAVAPIQAEIMSLQDEGKLRKTKSIHKGFYWDPQDKAEPNFLAGPFNRLRDELVELVFKWFGEGISWKMAMKMAGLRLQRESQEHVPVEFGHLKASAFTKVEE